MNAAIAAWRGSPAYAEAVKQFLKANQEVAAPSPDSRTYVVRAGDTLSGIARAELGDVERWRELWALNKTRFPDPNLIEVGDPVVLP